VLFPLSYQSLLDYQAYSKKAVYQGSEFALYIPILLTVLKQEKGSLSVLQMSMNNIIPKFLMELKLQK
jgi:hypothetical protein